MQEWLVSLPGRLDAFLASEGRMLSRTKAQQAVDEKKVKVNGEVVTKVSFRLQEGDTVSLDEIIPEPDVSIAPTDLRLTILHEDDACFVIDKPAGYAVHPGAGMLPDEVTILHGIAFIFKKKKIPFLGESILVHRLDKETTGCLLIAKSAAAHLQLQKQFETRTVEKTYLALVAGVPSPAAAIIDAPIGRDRMDRTMMSVTRANSARESKTSYETVEVSPAHDCALLECDLYTGRTHQVRVHLTSIGHPILGDGTYVNTLSERLRDQYQITHLCLHAWKLAFDSPGKKKRVKVEADMPGEFEELLKRIGFKKM